MDQMKSSVLIVGTRVLVVPQKIHSSLLVSYVFCHSLAVLLVFMQNHDMLTKALNLVQDSF